MEERKRIYSLDVARSLAIICVFLCHITETIFSIEYTSLNAMGYPLKGIPVVLMTVGALGVPIFLYITGFLLLRKSYDSQATAKFYRSRLLLLLIVSVIWTLCWRIGRCAISGMGFTLLTLIKDVFFASGNVFNHIWYLPMILNLYLLVPFLSNALHSLETKWIWLVLGIGVFFAFVLPLWNLLCDAAGIPALYSDFTFKMQTGFLLAYPVLGHLIRRERRHEKIPVWLLAAVCAAMFAATVFTQLFFMDHEFAYWLWYDNPFLLLCSFSLFLLLCRIQEAPAKRTAIKSFIRRLSRNSFGIYLVHYVWIDAFSPWVRSTFSTFWAYIVLAVLAAVCSWVFVDVLSLNRKLGKYLFFIH